MNLRIRSLVVVLLTVLGLAAFWTPAASASEHGTYLALGDSVPFGYHGPNTPPYPPNYSDPTNFTGFPELVTGDTHLNLLNASCPGETSASFIDPAVPSNGCATNQVTQYRGYGPDYLPPGIFPLHVDYPGSQLGYATHVLETDLNVRLVTIMLGANDFFRCQAATPDNCTSPAEIAATAQKVHANLVTIMSALRQTGYRGAIIAVTYYSLNYADPTTTAGTLALDGAIIAASLPAGARVASGFLAFLGPSLRAGGSPITAGLVYQGDVHPTPDGQALLARAVERALPR